MACRSPPVLFLLPYLGLGWKEPCFENTVQRCPRRRASGSPKQGALICYNTYPEILVKDSRRRRGLKEGKPDQKTGPILSMRHKQTCPACRQRVQCTLSLEVYRSPASIAILAFLCCDLHDKTNVTDLLDVRNLGGKTL